MKEHRRIDLFDKHSLPSVKRLHEQVYLGSEQVDLDAFVRELLKELPQALHEPGEVVLDMLAYDQLPPGRYRAGEGYIFVSEDRDDIFYQYYDDNGYEQGLLLSKDELFAHARLLRQRIQEKLRQRGEESVHLLGKRISKRVQDLEGQYVLKEREGFGERVVDASRRAEEYLFSLEERSPHIYYTSGFIDTRETSLRTIDRKIEFTTLRSKLEKRELTFYEALKVYADFLEANSFLIHHGLRCSDLDATNIGVAARDGRGFAFDFDGLRLEGESGAYLTKHLHMPPERYDVLAPVEMIGYDEAGEPIYGQKRRSGPITEMEMCYELGVTLKDILEWTDPYHREDASGLWKKLSRDMTQLDPEKRPSLDEVLRLVHRELETLDRRSHRTDAEGGVPASRPAEDARQKALLKELEQFLPGALSSQKKMNNPEAWFDDAAPPVRPMRRPRAAAFDMSTMPLPVDPAKRTAAERRNNPDG